MIFLLKYWKEVLGLIAIAGLAAVAFVFHVELVSAQHALTKCEAQSAVLSGSIAEQNAAIASLHRANASLQKSLLSAEHAAHQVDVLTVTKIERVKATPIGPSCKDAMGFLRKEAPLIGGHP
jgi:hypothetical protein